MHSTTVKRKRLISPLGLLSIAALFLAAFLLLKSGLIATSSYPPSRTEPKAIVSRDTDDSDKAGKAPDPLELAYLKVHTASGDISDAQIGDVLISLLRTGRAEEARQLLRDNDLQELEESQRLRIDIELARLESPAVLAASLNEFAELDSRADPDLTRRAIELSMSLQQPELSARLFERLAMFDSIKQDVAYQECGRFMLAGGNEQHAAMCFRKALSVTSDDQRAFDLRLSLLPLLSTDNGEQQQLVQDLLDDESIDTAMLPLLASSFLAIEQPRGAYRIYARLAIREPAQAQQWLPLAARWAEAANRPVDAAVFLDALTRLVPEPDKLTLFRRVEKLLLAAGQSREVYRRVRQRLAATESVDIGELKHGVELALQMGETAQALEWNARVLALEPDNTEVLTQQIDLALGESQLDEAMQMAQQLVQRLPQSREARQRLAHISEWNQQPEAARTHWLWLADAQHQSNETDRQQALHEVLRLSNNLFDSAGAARALRELTLLSKPDKDQITELVRHYVQDGQPRLASVALNDLNIVHGYSEFTTLTLARHEYEHGNYRRSLAAWNQFEKHSGSTAESILMRVELLWRLDDQSQAVNVAQALQGRTLLSQASDYQLRLLAEIGWQYRQPWLVELSGPHIASLENRMMQVRYGRRSLAALREQGQDQKAIDESIRLFSSTGNEDFALVAMDLALKLDDQQVLDQFAPNGHRASGLHDTSAYWTRQASVALRQGNIESARLAYDRALKLNPEDTEAIAGLIWMNIGAADSTELHHSLERFRSVAEKSPGLWQAMAVAYLQLGAASSSVLWFERALDQIQTDYGMLLTYADALEYAGRASDAMAVREYTLQQLRPILVEGTEQQQDLILNQYASLASRYGAADETEALVDYLLDQSAGTGDRGHTESHWREDIAISWLMATQRFEQARVLMANLHSKRLQAPAWQQLAVALEENDTDSLQAVIDNSGPLSIGNHILALRQLGNDREAYALAQMALRGESVGRRLGPEDIQVASTQYPYLRQVLPAFVSGSLQSRQYGDLQMAERGLSVRHTLPGTRLGFGLQLSHRTIDTQRYVIDEVDHLSDFAVSLFYGNTRLGGRLSAGLLAADDDTVEQGSAHWYRQNADFSRRIDLELAYNEAATQSAELLVAGLQHRATIGAEAALGKLPFIRLQADALRLHTRSKEESIADGVGAEAEFGLRGTHGAHAWSASVQAGQITYTRSEQLPQALQLTPETEFNQVLADESRALSLKARFGRGGVNSDFPTVSSPRYHLGASVGYYWPSEELGFHMDAGVGIRVLGGDELSFSIQHDSTADSLQDADATLLGVNYRYHF